MLYAFGDSFTFGQGLPDIGNRMSGPPADTSKHVWPVHLAKLLDTEVENHSRGGASMLYITKLFLDTYNKIKPGDIVVVAWTYFERWSVIEDGDIENVLHLLPNMRKSPGTPTLEEYLPFTSTRHNVEMFCILSTLVASLCKLKGVRFYQRALDRIDLYDLKKYKPDWYNLYMPPNGMLTVNGKRDRIEKLTGLKIDKLPDFHNNEDAHIWWAHVIHRQILRSVSY